MSRRSDSQLEYDPLALAAATWLACGVVLLGLTPLPLHDTTLGWSPAFWLLIAPCLLLVARRAFGRRPDLSARRESRSIQRVNVQAIRRHMAIARPRFRAHPRRTAA